MQPPSPQSHTRPTAAPAPNVADIALTLTLTLTLNVADIALTLPLTLLPALTLLDFF